MGFIITILFIAAVLVLWFAIEYWWVLLIVLGFAILLAILLAVFHFLNLRNLEKNVVSSELISREPIIERVSENTGYSIGYGKYLSYHDHYRYKNVITGYKVRFRVVYNNSKVDIVECIEGSAEYNKLMTHIK